MRIVHPTAHTVSLQIAVRGFTPAKGRGPSVWLAGASHIGESNYYAALQQRLDSQSLVLFEGIGDRSTLKKSEPVNEDSLQLALAKSLGLAFQLSAIDYEREQFRNSDLSVAEIQELLRSARRTGSGAGESADAGEAFQQLLQIMDGSSWVGAFVRLGVNFLGSSPRLQAMTKLLLIESLGRIQGDLSQLGGVPPEIQHLLKVIIQERNKVVLKELKAVLQTAKPNNSIAVFYGAGHMADMEARLRRELGYRPHKEFWLTAISVDTEEAGLSETEVSVLRRFIEEQLRILQRETK